MSRSIQLANIFSFGTQSPCEAQFHRHRNMWRIIPGEINFSPSVPHMAADRQLHQSLDWTQWNQRPPTGLIGCDEDALLLSSLSETRPVVAFYILPFPLILAFIRHWLLLFFKNRLLLHLNDEGLFQCCIAIWYDESTFSFSPKGDILLTSPQ